MTVVMSRYKILKNKKMKRKIRKTKIKKKRYPKTENVDLNIHSKAEQSTKENG